MLKKGRGGTNHRHRPKTYTNYIPRLMACPVADAAYACRHYLRLTPYETLFWTCRPRHTPGAALNRTSLFPSPDGASRAGRLRLPPTARLAPTFPGPVLFSCLIPHFHLSCMISGVLGISGMALRGPLDPPACPTPSAPEAPANHPALSSVFCRSWMVPPQYPPSSHTI